MAMAGISTPKQHMQMSYYQACDSATCGQPEHQLTTRSRVRSIIPPWWHHPSFWWFGETYGPPAPVGNVNDYSYSKYVHYDINPPDLRANIEVERPERYIPGQIYALGPLETRRARHCPSVPVDTTNRYPVFRGSFHWPASAMEERRQYACRSPDEEDGKPCSVYQEMSKVLPSIRDSGEVPCSYYAPPTFETGVLASNKKEDPCICKNGKKTPPASLKKLTTCICNKDKIFPPKQLEPCICRMKPLGVTGTISYPMSSIQGDVLAVEASLCPHHRDNILIRGYCPNEHGRPCPDVSGIMSGDACFNSSEKHRKYQMFKVGQPFRTEACRWYNEQFPTETLPPVERAQKKTFPEFHFSNL